MLATENVAAKREPLFVGLIILDGNTEFCWDAVLRALLLIKEDTFEDVCCKKAAFVVDDPFRNILSYCLT